jgi:carbon storage regulator
MLVLARKAGQTIRIGNGIQVTVTAIKGGTAFLGITADAAIPVHRQEVYESIRRGELRGEIRGTSGEKFEAKRLGRARAGSQGKGVNDDVHAAAEGPVANGGALGAGGTLSTELAQQIVESMILDGGDVSHA